MVSKGSGQIVLWPRYFDAALSRAQGRRVRIDQAVRKPDAAWIASAAKKAGFDPEVQETVHHPSLPYHAPGRVLVSKQGSKETVIQKVAAQLGGQA